VRATPCQAYGERNVWGATAFAFGNGAKPCLQHGGRAAIRFSCPPRQAAKCAGAVAADGCNAASGSARLWFQVCQQSTAADLDHLATRFASTRSASSCRAAGHGLADAVREAAAAQRVSEGVVALVVLTALTISSFCIRRSRGDGGSDRLAVSDPGVDCGSLPSRCAARRCHRFAFDQVGR